MNRSLHLDGIAIPSTKVLDRGWEGIVYRAKADGRLLLAWLEWRNGGYFERVRELSEQEFEKLRQRGNAPTAD